MSIQRRKNKIKYKIIFVILFMISITSIIWIIPSIIIINKEKKLISNKKISINDYLSYNIIDLYDNITSSNEIEINYENENKVVYDHIFKFEINVKNFLKENKLNIETYIGNVLINKENINEKQKEISINLEGEGLKEITIKIFEKEQLIKEEKIEIAYIKPYENQFLEDLKPKGVIVHYTDGNWERFDKTSELLFYSGAKVIRATLSWEKIEIDNKKDIFKFDAYDKWINKLTEKGIKIIACFNGFQKHCGTDGKLNTDEELQEFLKFAGNVIERYPQIETYEFINEPNYKLQGYITDEDIMWYTKAFEELTKNYNANFIIGGTSTPAQDTNSYITSQTFYNKIYKNGIYKYANNINIHPYDSENTKIQNQKFHIKMQEHQDLFNSQGGFRKKYITEYGVHFYNQGKQADKIIQQTTIIDEYNIEVSTLYNFWNVGTNPNNAEHNYGLITNDYLPKKSYYAMKNYYENTNGAEHIGTINLEEGLETHVYDKDGKPKIITWSNNTEKNITIPYKNFTAKDIYGNEIKNENGELAITTSPVYLDNIEEKYFYQAISNTATTKYTEFEEKFAEEIEKLPEIKQQTKKLKQQIEQIGKTETRIDEQTAKTLMQRHFQLGNSLINAYQNRRIETEKVKLSSMLDMLNDIGNSYEDLVTVTAKTRNADISQAKDLVKEVENIITSNSDIEIIYPAKILEFSKDYQEKAEYINGLEEENDIKTGLIVSKNLHSIYLSNWAKEFTNIYIDEYLKNNLIAENYSEKNITNQDVTVTLNIGDDTKITNNNGSNKYTFTENGEYTFEYERRGRNFRQTVKVENIDKQSPKITGVEEGQVYENKIKPIIEDENLETVRLIQDGRMIDNYINNAEIKEEGMYRIEAIDKAGNKTITSFEIIENISKEYIIENNIIKNIEANTTVEQFKENIKIQTEYNIQREGQTLEAKEKIATGDILQIGDTQYTLIVRGDIDKDSKITIKDLILLRQQIIGEKTLEDTAKTAGDIDLNKKIDARDIVKLRKLILTNNQ